MSSDASSDAPCDAPWLAGVDGCRRGWLAAFVHPTGDAIRVRIEPSFAGILAAPEQPAIVAVDMPIGLPARTSHGGRGPENVVRPLLGQRQSSVFSVPSRSAIAAIDYRQACHVALATSDPPRMVSKQLFMIAPKIREVDAVLRADAAVAARVFEVHPEVAFWRLNGERALGEPKKVKSKPYEPGLVLRRGLLVQAGIPATVAGAAAPPGAAADDLVDALACATIARRIHAGLAQPFPQAFERDEFGLPMAIWA
jgi:predicted RNase H-like nuclease